MREQGSVLIQRVMLRSVKGVADLLNVSVRETCGSVKMEDALKDTGFVMEQSIVMMVVMIILLGMLLIILLQKMVYFMVDLH